MAGFVPGLLPTNRSQEKEFAQAYEDVLERYKGQWIEGGGGEEINPPEWCKSGYCKLQYYVPLQLRLSVLKGLL
ncbi:hypothetical protein D4764_06G0014380 [Takifugu flavidus]|uniref:Uncharacterized protein n=1 Tax=Takifugu flavidus TaxID=433684 RepID=A0A5C6MZR5_9TELE|nr:hypothetical protein D4764_06G0014380 [Takifugu flavidus]